MLYANSISKLKENKINKKQIILFSHPWELQVYKETIQNWAPAITAWRSKLCRQPLGFQPTRQDYCSFITEWTLSLGDRTTRQTTRVMRIEINTQLLCQLPQALASNPPSSLHLHILLALLPCPRKNQHLLKSQLLTRPQTLSALVHAYHQFFPSYGGTKISNWKHWVLSIELKTKNNFKPSTLSFPAHSMGRAWQRPS